MPRTWAIHGTTVHLPAVHAGGLGMLQASQLAKPTQ